jgi:hypothetical protein
MRKESMKKFKFAPRRRSERHWRIRVAAWSSLRGGILAACVMTASFQMAAARGEVRCERQSISVEVSPDSSWVALVQEGVCSDGGLVTVSTYTVPLIQRNLSDTIQLGRRSEEPDHEGDVFVVDDYGSPQNRPLLQWLSPRKLQITIPNISGVGLQKNNYQGVDVVIKYEPDDPAARDRWKRARGLSPK